MANYFHLAPMLLATGSVIEPGNFGRVVLLHGLSHASYRREMAYEEIRKQNYPDRPSRLACLFACPTKEEAEVFRQTMPGFGSNVIYEVQSEEANPHIADILYAIEPPGNAVFDVKFINYYWEGWRLSDVPGAVRLREVLLQKPVTVIRRH